MTKRIATTKSTLVVLALLLGACGDDASTDADASTTTKSPTTTRGATNTPTTTAPPTAAETSAPEIASKDYQEFRSQTTACGGTTPVAATKQEFSAPDDLKLDPSKPLMATITTSCGDITVELSPDLAPHTVNSFVFLASRGYFDGTVSHRILPGFVIQAGDPTATGTGGPGYVVPDELPSEGFVYRTGVLAMANSGPNTSGSQFFIMVGDAALPPSYSVFGMVTDGFETMEAIVSVPLGTSANGEASVPLETVYIESITVTPHPS